MNLKNHFSIRSIFILHLLLLFTPCQFLFADTGNLKYLGIDQGLSNNSVRCIYQDHNGFMWFGTYDGLNRYDGYGFKVFRNKLNDTLSLPHNYIYTIHEDRQNNLWVGTGQGAVIYNSISASFSPVHYRNIATGKTEKLSTNTTCIRSDDQDNVFIGTNGRGLLVRSKDGQLNQIPFRDGTNNLSNYYVAALLVYRQQVWIFINDIGLCRYDYKNRKILLVNNTLKKASSMAGQGDQLWIGANSGVYQYQPRTGALNLTLSTANDRLTSNAVACLYLDQQQNLWIGTEGGGINIYHTATQQLTYLLPGNESDQLNSESVYALFEDKEARKWIGTLKGGINILDPRQSQFRTFKHQPFNPNSLINDFVSAFYEDPDKNIWIGTDGGGLSIWNRHQNLFTNYRHQPGNNASLSSNMVSDMLRDSRGHYWVSTYGGGINKFNKADGSFKQYPCINPHTGSENRNVLLLYEDRQNNLWATTFSQGQLYRFNYTADRFEMVFPALFDLIAFTGDADGFLWAGNSHQLIRIDPVRGPVQAFEMGKPVRAIYEDAGKKLWIGTEGGGLVLFNRATGQIEKRYSDADGLCNNAVLSIQNDDHGHLWLSTFNGLSRFNMADHSFKNYYRSDGLQSNQFLYNAGLRLASGHMLFGGIKGFSLFHPDSLHFTSSDQILLLTGLRIKNQPVAANMSFIRQTDADQIKKLEIPYDQAIVSFDFAALEYSVPDKINYAYFLKGWDKDWNFNGKIRTASYTGLKAGTYTLYLKATNTQGDWNPEQKVLTLTILPPWYGTWWAYLLYAGIAAGLIYLYNGYRVKQAQLQYEVQLAHMDAEKEKELNERKLSFFTDISHEFRTPLTLIINPLKEFISNKSNPTPGDLNIVYRNASRLLTLVDQLLHFQKTGTETDHLKVIRLNLYQLCRDVYENFSTQARVKRIQYQFVCQNTLLEVFVDREKMETVLFNLLSNAMKFTPDEGNILFTVTEKPNDIEITIADNGPGIPENVGDKLFERFYRVEETPSAAKPGFGIGLYLVKHFIDSHKGTISYQSKPDQGTTFRVTLRKGKAHFASEKIVDQELPEAAVLPQTVAEPDTVQPPSPPAELEELVNTRKSIVIVEDNAEVREYIKSIFQATFNVYEAENGTQGIRLSKQYIPDIVISDLMMQNGTGIELCHAVKSDPALNHVPVVLLTAASGSDMKLKGLECGADDYITKPFDKELLVARITNLLKNRSTLQNYFYKEITLQQNNLKVSDEYKLFLEKCIGIVEKHLDDEQFSIKTLAQEIGMSHSYLYKKVKSISGQSVNSFIRFIRLRKAAELFIHTNMNVNETAFEVGINDIKYFREQFNKLFGLNPSEYIKKYRKAFGNKHRLNKDFFKEDRP